MSKNPRDKQEKNKANQAYDSRNVFGSQQPKSTPKRESNHTPDLLELRWEKVSSELRSRFPEFVVAFGYGSGVIPQEGYNYAKEEDLPLLDLLIVVRDTYLWNQKNLTQNPTFYRGLDKLRLKHQPLMRDKWIDFVSAGISFHPYIQIIEGVEGKIGVIPLSVFIEDMDKLKYNVIAGRLAKPTKIVWGQQKPESIDEYKVIVDLLQRNYERTLAYGRLSFQYKKFIRKPIMDNMILMAIRESIFGDMIALSYLGDVRKVFGAEDPNKISRIYKGNQSKLEELYNPYFKYYQELGTALVSQKQDTLMRSGQSNLAALLNKKVMTTQQQESLNQQTLSEAFLHEGLFEHEKEFLNNTVYPKILRGDLQSVVQGPAYLAGEYIRSALRIKNFGMSCRILVTQIHTTPFITNLQYVWQKLRKGVLRKK